MKSKSMIWIAIVFGLLSIQAQSSALHLPVPVFGQEYQPWCWAATDRMIRWHFERADIPQCSIASELMKYNCCPAVESCIKYGNTRIPYLNKYNYSYQPSAAIPYETMISNINASQPWIYAIKYNGGGGHLMVGDGYSTDGGSVQYILIIDPLPVGVGSFRWVTYNDYKGGAGYSYSVLYQYYNLRLKP